MVSNLTDPIGIFDAGIGSLSIVQTVHKYYPQQDVIWLADRKSFPLGKKTADELFEIGKAGVSQLLQRGASQVIVAANVLSMVVLERLKAEFPKITLHGILPPIRQASQNGDFCILGVKSMVEDLMLKNYVAGQISGTAKAFYVNASPLIDELVETGVFITDYDRARKRVSDFMAETPDVPVYTLSSTHLPWLKEIFESVAPDKVFLDPADDLVSNMALPNNGKGTILALATENETLGMTINHLQNILNVLGRNDVVPQMV